MAAVCDQLIVVDGSLLAAGGAPSALDRQVMAFRRLANGVKMVSQRLYVVITWIECK